MIRRIFYPPLIYSNPVVDIKPNCSDHITYDTNYATRDRAVIFFRENRIHRDHFLRNEKIFKYVKLWIFFF